MNRNPDARRALGQVLREFREGRGLTQEALAFEAGFDRTYIGQVERAEKSPTWEMLWRVLAALRVSWTEFGQALDARPAVRRGPAAPPSPGQGRRRGGPPMA